MSENKIPLRKEQVALIEKLAHVHNLMGLPPAWGKILALLTVSDNTELTFEQIMDTLNLSKSGVSQVLKELELAKRISHKTKMGERKRYFHIRISDLEGQIAETFNTLKILAEVYREVLKERNGVNTEFNNYLSEWTEILEFIYRSATKR